MSKYVPLVVLALIAWSLHSRGVCRGDAGDFQLAAATLGLGHPSGCALLCLAAYPFACLWPGEALEGVTVFSWLCGLAALAWTLRLVTRLGVRPAIGVSATLGLALTPPLWQSWVDPDVYLPSLLLLVLAADGLRSWEQSRGERSLVAVAVSLGALLVTRITTVCYAPLALAALLKGGWRPSRGSALVLLGFTGAVVGGLAYIWLRDQPTTGYNYIERFNQRPPLFNAAEGEPLVKLRRLAWLLSARQYWGSLKPQAFTGRVGRLPGFAIAGLPVLAGLFGYGALCLSRRWPVTTLFVAGVALWEGMFLACYQVFDLWTLTVPLLWSLTILTGGALEALLAPRSAALLGLTVAGLGLAVTLARIRQGPTLSAEAVAAQVDWAGLPPGAVICTRWLDFPPLSYGQLRSGRSDVRVVNPDPEFWWPRDDQEPVFYLPVEAPALPEGRWSTRPEFGLWRARRELP